MHQSAPLPACAIAVMAKASSPGRTKTRLSPPFSLLEAADLNTSFLQDIAQNLVSAGRAASISPYMAFAPPGSEGFFREVISPDVALIEAAAGTFGACLFETIRFLLAKGHEAACVLNSDSPTLPTAILTRLASRLADTGDRAVIGPAEDGGYYVLGLKRAHLRLFEEIDWSTERVFDQTLERAAEIGLAVEALPPWYDVDDAAGLKRLHMDIFEAHEETDPLLTPSAALQTRALLSRMAKTGDLHERLAGDGRKIR